MKIRNMLITLTALMACLCFSLPAKAEFYQYTDDKGVVHYTDDYSTIPEPYQSQIDSHPETPKDTAAETNDSRGKAAGIEKNTRGRQRGAKESLENSASSETEAAAATKQPDPQTARLRKEREALVKEKEQLTQEYETILQKKEALDASREQLEDEAEIKSYNQKTQALNEKIKQYREKENALKSKIEQYNQRIKEQ